MKNTFAIELLKEKHCEKAARIRFEDKDPAFIPLLGMGFFLRLLKNTAKSKWGFALVCLDGDEIAGLSLAATDLKRYYWDVLFRKGFLLSLWTLIELMKNKKLIKRAFHYVLYPAKIPYQDIKAQWLTLVIKKDYRSQGVGRKLTFSLIEEFKRRNVKKFKSTVFLYNEVSRSMHYRYGFKSLGTFTFDNDQLEVFVYEIND